MIHLTRWRTVAATTTAAALAAGAFGLGAAVSNPPAAPTPIELTSEGTALSEPVDEETLVPSVDTGPPGGEATVAGDDGDSREAEVSDDGDEPSDEVVTPDAAPTEAAAPAASPAEADSPDEPDNSDEPDEPDDSDLPDVSDESDDSAD